MLSYLLLWEVQSVCFFKLVTRSIPSDSLLCEISGGSMVFFVTAVSNLPGLPTLHFSSSVRRTRAHCIPGWTHKSAALRPIQKHSWSVAFEDISCAACGWWSTLHCQSLLLKECMVPRVRSSRTAWVAFKCTCLPITALNLYWLFSCSY